MSQFDFTILTDARYVAPLKPTPYIRNVLLEDQLVRVALEKKGMKVHRTNWDDPEMKWSTTRCVLFRSTWDYFDRFAEFNKWLEEVNKATRLVNPYTLIRWNLDKHYLADLSTQGINIPPTLFLKKGESRTLGQVVEASSWNEIIVKPAVSGGGRHTYRIGRKDIDKYEPVYQSLLRDESLLIQEFQKNVITQGEVAFMIIGGKFSHAILKKAKKGDFRVQDDFGGSIHRYVASAREIAWAERVVSLCDPQPVYARVDAIWDNRKQMALSELELIEPELWFRRCPEAADKLACALLK